MNDEVYVGSAGGTICCRMRKNRYKAHKEDTKCHKFMNQIGAGVFYIELIEEYPCNSKQELHAREGYWIRELGTLNKRLAGRTAKEYYTDNRERKITYQKQYAKENRDAIKQYKAKHHEGQKVEVTCTVCNLSVPSHYLKRHQQTRKCRAVASSSADTSHPNE